MWYELHLHSRWHYQFSNDCNNLYKGIFKTVKTVYDRENLGLPEDMALEDSTVVFLEIGLIIMQLRQKNVIFGIDEMASNMTEPKRLDYKWNNLFGWISL